MKETRLWLLYFLLAVAQIILCNFLNLSQFMVLNILPMLIICLPVRYDTLAALAIAFVTGLAVDFFSNGMMGMTVIALVPLALVRHGIIGLVFGEEVYSRGENISVRRQGLPKMALGILLSCAVFFSIYLAVESAGTQGFWRWLLRLLLSSLISTIVASILAAQLESE